MYADDRRFAINFEDIYGARLSSLVSIISSGDSVVGGLNSKRY
jgi:hypothetical protein